jgi:hypothetical protein
MTSLIGQGGERHGGSSVPGNKKLVQKVEAGRLLVQKCPTKQLRLNF